MSVSERKVAGRSGIYDKPLAKPRGEVSLSAFTYLFSEMIQYYHGRVTTIEEIEKKLYDAGYGIGLRMIEIIGVREKILRRETKVVTMLAFISNTLWKHIFNKVADNLERSTENEDEYMIHETSPITNVYMDGQDINGASFLAGIVAGALESCRFNCRVTAHYVESTDKADSRPERVVFLVNFAPEVMSRDRKLG
jgi:trafficking protein particle complex subunit 5